MGDFYQHFRSEERPFIEKMQEWTRIVEQRSMPKLTDFLDPRQMFIIQTLVNRSPGVKVYFSGGYEEAERKRALITPEFIYTTEGDFQLSLLLIENQSSFVVLEHRDYLGALLNLGIIREKFGDLIVHKDHAQLVLGKEMVDYVRAHLQKVGRASVITTEQPLERIKVLPKVFEERRTTVASLRLDAVISEMLHLSRSKVTNLIKGGKVKVNWRQIDQPSFEINEKDLLSVSGFGRFYVMEISRVTKKGKISLILGVQKEKT